MLNKLNDDTLEKVSGGAETNPDPDLETKFNAAWRELGMDSLNISQMSQAEYLLEWTGMNPRPDVKEFLKGKKQLIGSL